MLCYYLRGARPIPKTVWLACIGWTAQNKAALTKAALTENDERFALAA